jgi:hypothetical protein
LRTAGGLPGLVAGRLLISSDIGLGLLDARPDLRAGFLAGLIGGILQMCDLLLQASTYSRSWSAKRVLIFFPPGFFPPV